VIFIADTFRDRFAKIGFNGEMIFTDPAIKPWRNLSDRQNCTWEIALPDGPIRLHVKRFPRMSGASPAQLEAEGYRLLRERGIPTALVAAWGNLEDGRSFIVTENLSGFSPADKLVQEGSPFDLLLAPTAELAARLHRAELHHRDLYLCHFMAGAAEIRLIDAARVRPLPGVLTRRRWIVKDLSQFWYSTLALTISDAQRLLWLKHYCAEAKIGDWQSLMKSIQRKSASIASHDARLRRREPFRNISIPRS
jgi:Lipopolysaccharide kinase (Kdo/WaaP) family